MFAKNSISGLDENHCNTNNNIEEQARRDNYRDYLYFAKQINCTVLIGANSNKLTYLRSEIRNEMK